MRPKILRSCKRYGLLTNKGSYTKHSQEGDLVGGIFALVGLSEGPKVIQILLHPCMFQHYLMLSLFALWELFFLVPLLRYKYLCNLLVPQK